jgi:lipoprotein-anchoring transpeptidase ErfK/SrfK
MRKLVLVAAAAAVLAGSSAAAAVVQTPAAGAGEYLVAHPSGRLPLLATPGGRAIAAVGPRTLLGSPTAVGVVARRGRWLAVTSETLPNGRLGWLDGTRVRLDIVRFALSVDRARHTLDVLDRGRVVRQIAVATGSPGSPTPAGRYVVTDKLRGARFGAVYGCCILALSGHQPHPPAGWSRTRDWRLAIHGGGGIGTAVSAGCLHASESDLLYLMRTIPRGTPVFVR